MNIRAQRVIHYLGDQCANIVMYRYNRYLAIASRVVRRSLKEDLRVGAERRGEMELRFAKWEVRHKPIYYHYGIFLITEINTILSLFLG
ncbi:hypothetical protein BT63DRAFT_422546 [Microthyrium microscopicum]|uniref:Uncharacterized protein n=1 Tax=Microthyrium microscopicum TaxID=703497 RepID=A0A6A6UIL5_9PEZI|nr:hypothetical protein BT63DRAFT_422546 [Microthyrium microscopicum]